MGEAVWIHGMGWWCAVNVDGEREGWLVRKPANVGGRGGGRRRYLTSPGSSSKEEEEKKLLLLFCCCCCLLLLDCFGLQMGQPAPHR